MKNKKLIGLVAITMISGLILSRAVLASPPSAPPFPNATDATFSSIDVHGNFFNSTTTPSGGGRPPRNNPVDMNDSLDVSGGISATGIGAPFGSFNSVDIDTGLRVSNIWPIGFDVDTRFENGGIIISNAAGGGGPTKAAITKTGAITGTSIGRFYNVNGPLRTVGAGSPATPSTDGYSISCSAGDVVVHCSADTYSSRIFLNGTYMGAPWECTGYVSNTGSAALWQTRSTCFSPNG